MRASDVADEFRRAETARLGRIEQLYDVRDRIGHLGIRRELAESEVAVVVQLEIVTAVAFLVDVHVGGVHVRDHARVGRIGRRIAVEHVAEAVRINRRAVAPKQDIAGAEAGDFTADEVVEVIHGHVQVGKGWRPDEAQRLGARILGLEEALAAALIGRSRRVATRGVVARNTGSRAVLPDEVVGAVAPVDARIDRGLGQEARLVAEIQLIQTRGAVRGTQGATHTVARGDLPVQAIFPDMRRVANGIVLENSCGQVGGQRLDARQALQQRNTHFAKDFVDVVCALGFGRTRQAPGGRGRLVVDGVVTVFGANRSADRTRRQVEQVAVGQGIERGLCVHGVAGNVLADGVDQLVHALAVQHAWFQIVDQRTVEFVAGIRQVAAVGKIDAQHVVIAVRARVGCVRFPRPAAGRSEAARQFGGAVEIIDIRIGVQREWHDRLEVRRLACVARLERIDPAGCLIGLDDREELAVTAIAGLAIVVQPLRIPVHAAEAEIAGTIQTRALLLIDRVGIADERKVELVLVIGLRRVGVGLGRIRTQVVTRERALGAAIRRRHEAVVRTPVVDDRIGVEVVAARKRGTLGDGMIGAVDALAVRAPDHVLIAGKEVALAALERFLAIDLRRNGYVAVLEIPAGTDRGQILLAAAVFRNAFGERHFSLIHALLRDQVDHAGDRVGTVDRGRTVLHDFGALQDDLRDDVKVEGADLAARAGRTRALAIKQDQGAVRAEAAQVDRLHARATLDDEAAKLVVDLRRTGRDCGRLQEVSRRKLSGGDIGAEVDNLHRRRRLVFRAVQQRARDRDALQGAGFFLLLLVGVARR